MFFKNGLKASGGELGIDVCRKPLTLSIENLRYQKCRR